LPCMHYKKVTEYTMTTKSLIKTYLFHARSYL